MNKIFFSDKSKLVEILHFYNFSIANFNRNLGVKSQELYQISAGNQQEFSRDMLKAIAKHCPEVSPYWLITGEGSMLAGSAAHHNAVASDHSTATVTENGGGIIESQQATIDRLSRIIEKLTR